MPERFKVFCIIQVCLFLIFFESTKASCINNTSIPIGSIENQNITYIDPLLGEVSREFTIYIPTSYNKGS